MPTRGGLTFASDQRLITTTSAITTSYFQGGLAVRSDGAAYINDLGASAVPATALALGSFAFSPTGVMYVTTQAVAASDTNQAGARLRADGALRVIVASPAASDPSIGGWTYKQSTGQLYIQEIA